MVRASYERQKELRKLILGFFEEEDKPYVWKDILLKARKERISPNTLSKYLKEFIKEGLIMRKVDQESTPPKVFYIKRPISPFEKILLDLEKPLSKAQLLEKIKKIAEETGVYDKNREKAMINLYRNTLSFYFEVLKLFTHALRGTLKAKKLEDGIAFMHHFIFELNLLRNLIDSQVMLLWEAKDIAEDALMSAFINIIEPCFPGAFKEVRK